MPACNGRGVAEGFTYRFRDPHRGEIVVFHASGEFGGAFTPDPSASGSLEKRVIGIPGDTVVGRGGRVRVNGTESGRHPNTAVSECPSRRDEYYVLGDNGTFSQDSRDFGPVPRDAIFARTCFVSWPPGRLGVPVYDKSGVAQEKCLAEFQPARLELALARLAVTFATSRRLGVPSLR